MPFRGSAAAKPLRRPPQIQGKGKKDDRLYRPVPDLVPRRTCPADRHARHF
nr:MAG TPA: hypothetical protein [Inoviridae sp.]